MKSFNDVQKVIADQLGIDIAKIKPESDLINDLKADSLEIAEMLFLLEEKFGVELSENDVKGLKVAGDVAALIDRLSE